MFPQCVNEVFVEGFSVHPLPQAVWPQVPTFCPGVSPRALRHQVVHLDPPMASGTWTLRTRTKKSPWGPQA